MRILCAIFIALFSFVAIPVCAGTLTPQERESKAASCGTERIQVKTLTDPDAPYVHLNPTATTVEYLRSLPVPKGYNRFNDASRYDAEKQVYAVQARIIGFKLESDRDFHIVISDPFHANETMIVEPPDPACPLSQKDGDAGHFAGVRALMVKCFGQPTSKFRRLEGKPLAVFTGVGYFDPIHGQTGVAPNGVELHPLLRLQFETPCGKGA